MSLIPSDNKPKVNPIILVGAAGALLFLFMYDTPKQPKAAAERTVATTDPEAEAFLETQTLSPETKRMADSFFKEGFREYRELNFLRAKQHFETVLQIAPSHGLARRYLQNAEKSIADEVKKNLELGRTATQAGKLREAKGYYASVLRLLYRDNQSPEFKVATEELEKLEKLVRGDN